MKKCIIFNCLILVLVCQISITDSHSQSKSAKNNFIYSISPKPTINGIDLAVSLKFDSDSTLHIDLPKDYYGVKNYQQYFINFQGLANTKLELNKSEYTLELAPNKNGEIHITYMLSLSSNEMNKYSFSPNISNDHFHVTGSQIFLPVGKIDDINVYEINIVNYPKNWKFYSSLSSNPTHMNFEVSYQDLISSGFGGGNQEYSTFMIKNKPVSVFIQGEYLLDKQEIINSVKNIIGLQREWFNDFEQPFYTVTIMQKGGHVAGFSVPNLFVCYIKKDITKIQLYKLLSHEMFHRWLPHKLKIKTNEDENDLMYSWFYEGFTDYLSRKVLLEAGIINYDQFVEIINNDIYLVENNSSKNESYQEILERKINHKFTGIQHKLFYHKGSLIALQWDYELKANSNKQYALKNLIFDLINIAKSNNNEINFQDLVSLGNTKGLNVEEDFRNYILDAKPVQILPNSFKGYKLESHNMHAFELGFSVQKESSKLIINDVTPNSTAYEAGLRNGMEYITSENDNPYSNAWVSKQPIKVTVKLDSGSNQMFEYYSEGEPLSVAQFVK